MNNKIINQAKRYFYERIMKDNDLWDLLTHVPQAEKWGIKILQRYPEADKEVVFLSIWLHDIAHYDGDWNIDHALKGEKVTRQFLTGKKYNQAKLEAVCHCVRAHRNKDVKPETLEAKLMCLIDSISHFSYAPYVGAVRDGRGIEALAKLERDYRDLKIFPEIAEELKPVYTTWKKLLKELMKTFWYEPKK